MYVCICIYYIGSQPDMYMIWGVPSICWLAAPLPPLAPATTRLGRRWVHVCVGAWVYAGLSLHSMVSRLDLDGGVQWVWLYPVRPPFNQINTSPCSPSPSSSLLPFHGPPRPIATITITPPARASTPAGPFWRGRTSSPPFTSTTTASPPRPRR